MSTIPASAIVNVNPGVLSAAGNDLQLLGIEVTQSYRVPVGTVASYPSAAAVAAAFGAGSVQANNATTYFNGYTGKSAVPQAMLFAQWVAGGVGAWLQSGNINALGLAATRASPRSRRSAARCPSSLTATRSRRARSTSRPPPASPQRRRSLRRR